MAYGILGGPFGFGGLIGVIALLAAIWVIYDVLVNNTRLSTGMKVVWIVFALLFSIITAIIYLLVGRRDDMFHRGKHQ